MFRKVCSVVLILPVVLWAGASWGAIISVMPATQNVPMGGTCRVDINVTGVSDLYGWQFSLGYNSDVLGLSSVSKGSFLGSGGGSTFFWPPNTSTPGLILSGSEILTGGIPGVSGSGTLLTLNFSAHGVGSSLIDIFLNDSPGLPTRLMNSEGYYSPVLDENNRTNGIINVAPIPSGEAPLPSAVLFFASGLICLVGLSRKFKDR